MGAFLAVMLAFVYFSPTVGWLILVARITSRLKRDFPEIFAELGSPDIVLNNTPANNVRFIRFVFGEQAHTFPDDVLRSMCKKAGFLFLSSTATFVVAIGCFIYALIAT